MSTYYYHNHGCGTGSTTSFIKLNQDNSILCYLNSRWMGSKYYKFKIKGKYIPRDGSYGIFHLFNFTNLENNENIYEDVYFDTYKFDKPLKTEWGMELPIGLYMGNGSISTEQFQLHLIINKSLMHDGFCHHDENVKTIAKTYDGLKYEMVSKDRFDQLLKIYIAK